MKNLTRKNEECCHHDPTGDRLSCGLTLKFRQAHFTTELDKIVSVMRRMLRKLGRSIIKNYPP